MKKTLTISALTAVLSLPSFAEIANNATCNNTNLGKSANGDTAQTEAVWNANTININWYNGDTKITSNTCTYDGTITLPAQPTKPGYTFAGWRLRAAPVVPNCSAITNSTTCENTDGCIYNDGCHVAIPVETSSYTKCSEITDRDTCLSMVYKYDDDTSSYNIACIYDDGQCRGTYQGGGDQSYGNFPQSWCEDMYGYIYGGSCEFSNGRCNCWE